MKNKNKRRIINVLIILLMIPAILAGNVLYGDYKQDLEFKDIMGNIEPLEIVDDLLNFKPLQRKNKDIICWLKIDGTQIDYPVVQAEDNDYYIHRDLKGQHNRNGTLFMDYRLQDNFSNYVNMIYGHNMRSGMMFQAITLFASRNYFDDHKTGTLYTPNKTYSIHFFAYAATTDGSDFYKIEFSNEEERMNHLEMIQHKSMNSRNIELDKDHKLIILSTCGNALGKTRSVLIGVLD